MPTEVAVKEYIFNFLFPYKIKNNIDYQNYMELIDLIIFYGFPLSTLDILYEYDYRFLIEEGLKNFDRNTMIIDMN